MKNTIHISAVMFFAHEFEFIDFNLGLGSHKIKRGEPDDDHKDGEHRADYA